MKRRTQEDPKDVQAFLNLSWISSLSDHPQDAVEAARQATKLAPTESVGFTNMCRAYNDLKLFDSAVQACTDALKIKPGDGETYFYMARAKYEQKKVGESQLLFERAAAGLVETTRQNPANADNFYLLGNAYYASNQTNKAIASYFKALEINPRYVKARYNLGLIYAQMGDYKSAKDQYNLLVALDQPLAAKLLPKIEKPK
jgi:tetratricopeptide (TPR) repeat protein